MSYRLRKGLYVVWHYAKTIIKCWVTLFFFFNGSPPCTKSDCVMRWMLVFYFNTKSLFFIGSLASPPLIKEEKSNCFFFYKKRVFKKQKCKKRRKRKQNCKGKRKKMECVWEGGGLYTWKLFGFTLDWFFTTIIFIHCFFDRSLDRWRRSRTTGTIAVFRECFPMS